MKATLREVTTGGGRRCIAAPRLSEFKVQSLKFQVLLLVAVAGIGAGVRVAWESNAWPGAGYVLYYGGASRTYTNAVDTGSARTNVVRGLKAGADYFFAVTAYDPGTRMESDFSAETKVALPISLGSNVVWTVATAPTVTGTWARVYGPVTNGVTNLAGFVRLMVERR